MASSSQSGPHPPSDAIRFGDCSYDPGRRELRRGGATVEVTTKAFDLLGILIQSRPLVLTKDDLRDRLWPGVAVGDTSLAKLVTELRQATADDAREPRFIRTVHRFGYAFCGEVVPESLGREVVEARRPYPGLQSFTEADAAVFFGREREVEALWEKLRRLKLLALIGASGAGKTSFIRAGVLPARPDGWGTVVCTPGGSPMRMLGQALATDLAGDAEALKGLLQFDDPQVAVGVVGRWRRAHTEALLVVDQAEELFTLSPAEIQRSFATLLRRIVEEADVHVLLSLRDDFLMRCHEHAALAPVFDGLTPLGPPRAEDLRRGLVEPASKYGYRFENDGLVDAMLAEVEGARGALPLVAFAAAQLWERRERTQRVLTHAAYREIGGVAGALAQHADATIDRIGMDRAPLVRELFRNLVTAQGTRLARDREELLSVFPDRREAGDVLDVLIDARLLTAYDGRGAGVQDAGRRVEIIHESLLTAWPRLVRWRAQDAEGALLRDQLRQATLLWEERGRPEDLLWTATSLREYELWRERYPGRLTAGEEAFAAAMSSAARRRRQRQRFARVAALAAAVAVAAVTSGLWRRSESSRARAEQQTARAEAARLLALGRLDLEGYPTATLAYATASLEMADTPEARRLALQALWRGPAASILPLPPGVWWRLDLSPDDKWVAVTSFGETVVVYPSSGGSPLTLGGHELPARQRNVRFGPDAKQLFTNAEVDPIRVWSIPEGTLARTLDLPGRTVFDVSAGRLVTVTQSAPGAEALVRSWPLDGEEGTILGRLTVEGVPDAAVDPTGRWLAFARQRRVLIRPLAGLPDADERLLGEHPHDVTRLTFDAKGTRLLSRDKAGAIRIWPLSGAQRAFRVLQTQAAGIARFGPGGTGVIVGDPRARSVGLWTLEGPPDAAPFLFQRADNGNVMETDVTSDGRWLAFANGDSVIFWPLARIHPYVLEGHVEPVMNLVFAGDGKWLASGSMDGTVRVWPLNPQVAPESKVVLGPSGVVYGLAADRQGHRLLTGLMKGPSAHVLAPWAHGDAAKRQLHPAITAPWGVTFDYGGCHAIVASSYSPTGVGMVMRIWDLASGSHKDLDLRAGVPRTDPSDPYEGGVVDLEPAPNGRILSTGFGGVRRWDPHGDSSETLRRGEFGRADLSPDGKTLAVVSLVKRPFFGELNLLDVDTGSTSKLSSHGREVMDVAFHPSGKTIVTASADGAVRVGPVTGAEPHLLLGHEGSVAGLAVSPDGQWIASSGHDGTVRLWPMPDLSKPPLHTLSRDALLTRLKSLTNLRALRDPHAQTGWKLDLGPFPGWETVPAW